MYCFIHLFILLFLLLIWNVIDWFDSWYAIFLFFQILLFDPFQPFFFYIAQGSVLLNTHFSSPLINRLEIILKIFFVFLAPFNLFSLRLIVLFVCLSVLLKLQIIYIIPFALLGSLIGHSLTLLVSILLLTFLAILLFLAIFG